MNNFVNTRESYLRGIGELYRAEPNFAPSIAMAEQALARGESDDTIKKTVRKDLNARGAIGPQSLFPNLTKAQLNTSVRKYHIDRLKSADQRTTIHDLIEPICKSIGYDDWAVDHVISLAKGEKSSSHAPLFGGVITETVEVDGDKVPVVIATWYPGGGDFESIADEFREACRVRGGDDVGIIPTTFEKQAEAFVAKKSDSYGDLAKQRAAEKLNGSIPSSKDNVAPYPAEVAAEKPLIYQQAKRMKAYLTKILSIVSGA